MLRIRIVCSLRLCDVAAATTLFSICKPRQMAGSFFLKSFSVSRKVCLSASATLVSTVVQKDTRPLRLRTSVLMHQTVLACSMKLARVWTLVVQIRLVFCAVIVSLQEFQTLTAVVPNGFASPCVRRAEVLSLRATFFVLPLVRYPSAAQ